MTGSKSINVCPSRNVEGFGNMPKGPKVRSAKKVDAGYGNRGDQCPAPKKSLKKPGVEIISRIKEHQKLVKEAEITGRYQDAQKSINHLIAQLALGNPNSGRGTRQIFKNVFELRGQNRTCVYYRRANGKVEILGKLVKKNQKKY